MAVPFLGCHLTNEQKYYSQVSDKDEAMNAAIQKAKATSGEFVQAFHAKSPGTGDFAVKKPYSTPTGSQEHMWIEVQEEIHGVVKGIVANEAEETREVKIGQPVTLNMSEISDWKYLNGNKLIGGYTIRYFADKMSPAERKELEKEGGFEL